MLFLSQKLVQQGTREQNDDTEIHPQHQQDHVCEAAVDRREGTVVIDVQGVEIGEGDPEEGRQACAGQFVPYPALVVGNKAVQAQKVDKEDHKGYA